MKLLTPGQEPPQEVERIAEELNCLLWAVNHIKAIDNHPFDLSMHPYLLDYFDDPAQETVTRKSAQTRFSMTAIQRFIHRTGLRNLNGIYYFPTDSALYPFMQSRFDRLVDLNPDIRQLVPSTDNTTVKQIGNAIAYFFGLKGKTQKESSPADHEVFDEVDLMSPTDIEIAKERMQDSTFKLVDYISTPTLPDFGVDALFKDSDQKYWTIKCSSCGRWNECDFGTEELPGDAAFIFPECIEQGFLACRSCLRKLNVLKGQWVPKYPGNKRSGRFVSRLFVHGTDYVQLLEEWQKAFSKANFYNRRLGLPYADVHSRITRELVLKLCGNRPMVDFAKSTTMGIDVNPEAGHHYVVSQRGRNRLRDVVALGTVRDLEAFDVLIRKWDVKKFVIDAMPDQEHARKLCERFPGKGFLCFYNRHQKDSYAWDDEKHRVTVNRTESLDASQRLLRESLVELPIRSGTVEDFAEHCGNIAKRTTYDPETGDPSVEYVQLGANKPDHYRHAFNYDSICWYHGQGNQKPVMTTVVPDKAREIIES